MDNVSPDLLHILTRYWGYKSFRPFQQEVISAVCRGKDTVTVLPTGGGKSVCFQVPALAMDGLCIVISPLIALMKDQVDYLKDMGVPAACLNSALTVKSRQEVLAQLRSGTLKLLYISPERLLLDGQELLSGTPLSFFVIDEAHCISHWGHDFRAEYRQLRVIKERFNNIPVHAFTATATQTVQKDIIAQLGLREPELFVGNVDRPNLIFRALPRSSHVVTQIVDIIRRHPNDPGIVYCLKRDDVDRVSAELQRLGYDNVPYHAGLSDGDRRKNQDAFASEKVPIVVATIAFGMGVDRSNIRYVIHAAMPKSIEHYQQETGRAGRDGLPSECWMFYGGADYRTWEYILGNSPERAVMMQKLSAMYNFCTRPQCRHRFLVNYFGQAYDKNDCAACDLCLGEVDMVEEPLLIGQKILSCVARVRERFGAAHVAAILQGSRTEAVGRFAHDKLSTFGIMADRSGPFIRFMIEQLLGQGFLKREGEYGTLAITEQGKELLRGNAVPVLAKPVEAKKKKEIEKKRKARHEADWEGIDEKLFGLLREKRAEIAREKNVPAYIVFSDKSLLDMARVKPASMGQFATIFGVGETKRDLYGETFLAVIREHAEQ